MSDGGDGFLSRWSRRKTALRQGVPLDASAPAAVPAPLPVPMPAPTAVPASPPSATDAPATEAPREPLPTLDDVAALTPDSDFARFVKPEVDAEVKNAAMKKLFADPHFNVMDGLDTYIDDYSKPDPLPESMLRQMAQAKFLGLFREEDEAAEAAAAAARAPHDALVAGPDGAPAAALSQSAADATAPNVPATTDPTPTHEDAAVQLQPDPAAGPAGPAPSPGAHAAGLG